MTPEISIVVGASEQGETLTRCLEALSHQISNVRAELIVVVPEKAPELTITNGAVLRVPGDPLVPQLWGAGIERAMAPLIAVLSGQCIPAANWIEAILTLSTTHPSASGYGGPINLAEGARRFDQAVYFSRYGAFIPPMNEGPAAEIAGDNAAYWKTTFDRYWSERESGFWETLVHHSLRRDGKTLLVSNSMVVRLGATRGRAAFLVARMRHGMHYASTRPDNNPVRRAARFVLAPLLIPVLMARAGKRARERGEAYAGRYRRARPWLLLIFASWSLGEAFGYLRKP